MSDHIEPATEVDAVAVASEPVAVAVGDIVRLATGQQIEVRGVRRTADGVWIMRGADEWLDADGIEIVPRD